MGARTGSAPPSVACPLVTRTRMLPATVALALLAMVGCSGSDGAATASLRSEPRSADAPTTANGDGTIAWSTCTDDLASLAGLDCGGLQVPLDPTDPNGDTIELAVARSSATGSPDERIGSLVLNPGGPGGSGIEFLANAAAAFPESLTDRFDLVSFDPRGVAESSPVRCIDDETKDAQLTGDLSPDTPDEVARAIEDQREFLKGCESNSEKLLTHMSTADVAADLDELRQALGDEQLTYLGYSYGTEIGAVYATLFPESTRALVLDGSVSPDADDESQTLAQAQGFERTFANFVAACDADQQCALAPDALARIDAVRAQLAAEPLVVDTAEGDRTMGVDLFDLAVATALYDTGLWGTLAGAIDGIDDGGGATLLSLVDRQIGRQPDGSYDNSTDAQTMVSCADTPERPTVDEAEAAAERIIVSAPRFGPAIAWSTLGCLDWPLAANPVPELTGAGAPPVLVVGTVGDPATPYEWSVRMSEVLESATLLTYEGDGHTAFLRGGPCIETAVVDYLVDLQVPAADTRCPAQGADDGFQSIRDEVVSQFVEAGLPEPIAECVVDGILDEIGEDELNRIILSGDPTELTRLVTAQSIRCATAGG